MALARVDETLTAVSTTLVDPDNNTEPMFLVQIVSESRKETWVRVRGQSLAMQVDDNRPTAADPTSYLFQIPCQVVAQPASCFHYIAHMISCSDFSASLSNDLASKIAAFSDNLVRAGCFGFFVLAHVEVVEGTFHVVEPIFDTDRHFQFLFSAIKKPMRHCDVLSVYYRRIKVSDWVYHMGLLYSPVYVAAFFIACRGLATTVPYVTYCCHFPYVLLYI
ncbi:hypothetical protein D5086_024891 [Populus alba]|uniref:Uncharacterized protein n=1 Tax=Populus alba TaxID=43335 RepID=A0ACC4B8K1_POPAL